MWSAGSEAQAYLTQRGAWLRVRARGAVQPLPADGWQGGLNALGQALAESKPRRLRLWLSGALARPFMLEPVPGLRDRQEALRLAQAQTADATGLAGACVVWMDAWKPDQPCLAVAVEQHLIDAAQAMAAEACVRLTGIAPGWNAALYQRIGAKGDLPKLLAVEDADALTVLGFGSGLGQGGMAFSQAIVPAPAPERMNAQLQRLAMSRDVATEAILLARVAGFDAQARSVHASIAVRWQAGLGT